MPVSASVPSVIPYLAFRTSRGTPDSAIPSGISDFSASSPMSPPAPATKPPGFAPGSSSFSSPVGRGAAGSACGSGNASPPPIPCVSVSVPTGFWRSPAGAPEPVSACNPPIPMLAPSACAACCRGGAAARRPFSARNALVTGIGGAPAFG